MTKRELEELIHGVAASMIYGHYLAMYAEKEGDEAGMIERMKTKGYKFQAPDNSWEEGLEAEQLHAMFSNASNLHTIKSNFFILLRMSLVRFAFEAILHYVNVNGHKAAMKQEPWFYYTRIVRNVTSHRDHMVLDRWDSELTDKGIAEATWRHRKVTTADVGKEIPLDSYDAWKLHLDMLDFVQKRLP